MHNFFPLFRKSLDKVTYWKRRARRLDATAVIPLVYRKYFPEPTKSCTNIMMAFPILTTFFAAVGPARPGLCYRKHCRTANADGDAAAGVAAPRAKW